MSEKRFTLDSDFVKVTSQVAWDNQEEKGLTLMKLVDLLNTQQATITGLEQEIELISNTKLFSRRELERKVDEQQAIIQQKDKQLEKAKEYFMDYLSREMSANNFSELWDLVIDV